jgi:hypothetical protein
MAACWSPLNDLLIGTWREPKALLVGARVEARVATFFGSGDGAFPDAALKAQGLERFEVLKLAQNGAPTAAAMDLSMPLHATRLKSLEPTHLVEVTWRTTVAELIGDDACAAFERVEMQSEERPARVLAFKA